jgi:hypothetical protein
MVKIREQSLINLEKTRKHSVTMKGHSPSTAKNLEGLRLFMYLQTSSAETRNLSGRRRNVKLNQPAAAMYLESSLSYFYLYISGINMFPELRTIRFTADIKEF